MEDRKGCMESMRPLLSMILVQIFTTGMLLPTKMVLDQGTFIFALLTYRNVVATLLIAPLAFLKERGKEKNFSWSVFMWIFLNALSGENISHIPSMSPLFSFFPFLSLHFIFLGIRYHNTDAGILSKELPMEHDRVVDGLVVAVHERAHRLLVAVQCSLCPRRITPVVLHHGPSVLSRERDDPHALAAFCSNLARARSGLVVAEIGELMGEARDYVADVVIKLFGGASINHGDSLGLT